MRKTSGTAGQGKMREVKKKEWQTLRGRKKKRVKNEKRRGERRVRNGDGFLLKLVRVVLLLRIVLQDALSEVMKILPSAEVEGLCG